MRQPFIPDEGNTPGPRSMRRPRNSKYCATLYNILLMDASQMAASIGESFAIQRQLTLVETVSKMMASIGGRNLQFKEQLSLGETDGHFRGGMGRFCLLSQNHGALESSPRRTLNTAQYSLPTIRVSSLLMEPV